MQEVHKAVVKGRFASPCNIWLSVKLGSAKTHLYIVVDILNILSGRLTLQGVASPLYTVAIVVFLL